MTIRETFERAVREHPDAAFQRFYDGTRWVNRTYREAYGRMLKAAAVVSRLDLGEADADGVRPRVAIMMENCPDWQILYLAITGAGLVVVPIDPKLRAGEVGHILADSGARAVFCGEKQLGVVVEAATAVGNYPIVKIENPSAVIDMVKPEAARLAEEYLASRGTPPRAWRRSISRRAVPRKTISPRSSTPAAPPVVPKAPCSPTVRSWPTRRRP